MRLVHKQMSQVNSRDLRNVQRRRAQEFRRDDCKRHERHDADNQNLEDAEPKSHGTREREDSLEAVEWIDVGKIGRELAGHKQKADLHHVRRHAPEAPQIRGSVRSPRPSRASCRSAARRRSRDRPEPGVAAQLVRQQATREFDQVAPANISTNNDPSSNSAEARSWLCATCPSSRACWRRCGVASCDLSPVSSATG